ncbi:MAG: hypothetical protein ACLFV8_06025 [Alphaproteobacteria bacterium]
MSRETDWDLVATLYADHSVPLREIERRCGVARSTITSRAKREGWPARRPHRHNILHRPKYRILINRMFRTLDRQMREIEQRLKAEAASGRSATARERDARTLSSLTRTLEKLGDLEKEAAAAVSAEAQSDAHDREETLDTEGMRAELEGRLARLLAETGENGVSGKPE